jgi:hypothetical protein
MAPIPEVQVNYPQTTLQIVNESGEKLVMNAHKVEFGDGLVTPSTQTTILQTGISSQLSTFDMSFNELTFGGVAGTLNQVLTTNASGVAHWEDPQVSQVNLADVLSVSPAGEATLGQTISNIASISLQADNGNLMLPPPIVISERSNGILDFTCSYPDSLVDNSKVTQAFTGDYLVLSLNGTTYRLQLFNPA